MTFGVPLLGDMEEMPPAQIDIITKEWHVVVPWNSWQHDRDSVKAYLGKMFAGAYGFPASSFDDGAGRCGPLNSQIRIRVVGHRFKVEEINEPQFKSIWPEAHSNQGEVHGI